MQADTDAAWEGQAKFPDLGTGATHVWMVDLEASQAWLDRLNPVLSDEERVRAARFHFLRDRTHFTLTRGLLRVLLAGYLQRPAFDLVLRIGAHGKPFLDSVGTGGSESALHFNVSHSGGRALLAFCREGEVGVDVERIRDSLEGERLAERFFSPREVAELQALPPEQVEAAFFRCWTRKEAYVKARGIGLSLGLDTFAVSFRPGDPARLVWSGEGDQELHRWRLWDLPAPPRYFAALACPSQATSLRLFRPSLEALLS